MKYPEFIDNVETITMRDPLSDLLGTFEDGIVEFRYVDIVKAAGHSCPTVAGAYLMTLTALKELYGQEIPVRGMIKVELPKPRDEGVSGVIANIITHITGATEDMGFKGLRGKFSRINLMDFSVKMQCSARFTRMDTSACVEALYDPSCIQPHQEMAHLMPKSVSGSATEEERKLFGEYWQERVSRIFAEYREKEIVKISRVEKMD